MAAIERASAALRQAALARLLVLDQRGELTSRHVRLTAGSLGVSERTMWRGLRRIRCTGECGRVVAVRLAIDDVLRRRLAYWRGNAAAVHRELVDAQRAGGAPAPSLATLHRAIRRDLSPGERAGLRKGEQARRAFDVFLRRPATHRNAVWEADHVEAPVEVELDGRLVKPWVTWFVDTAHKVVCGVAITPGPPSRESILVALRAAILREEPYGPAGGLPGCVRIDQGRDFLSRTVAEALGALSVRVTPMPGYQAHLKGTVEGLNGAVEKMFFAGLPRYTHAQTLLNRQHADPEAPGLSFERFVAEMLAWVRWWNHEHTMPELDGRTPIQAWLADPTPLEDVSARDLWFFTLEDDGRVRTITTKGVAWGGRGRHYVADWMVGHAGAKVRVRYMPHHDHEVEVFDAATGAHLGAAVLSDQAPPEVVKALLRARAAKRNRLAADLRAAEKVRRQRYAATTTTGPATPLGAVTVVEVAAELAATDEGDADRLARPELVPRLAPPPGWVVPLDPDVTTEADTGGDGVCR